MRATNNSKGRDYERLIAAIFRADGHLVERNRRTPEGAADMDLLAWRPHRGRLTCTLVECKCEEGPPGATDLFVLKGRQALVGADRPVFVSAAPFGAVSEAREIARQLEVELADGTSPDKIECQLRHLGLLKSTRSDVIEHWRCVFEVEDACRAILQTEGRRARIALKPGAAIARAQSYLSALDSLWWCRKDPWLRAVHSYQLHRRNRLVAQDVAVEYEAAGCGRTPEQHLAAAYAKGWCPPAQAALYVQMRARMMLALLAAQCALDLRHDRSRRMGFFGLEFPRFESRIPQELPQPFVRFVEELYDHPQSSLVFPVLLQTWQTGWGGFLLLSKRPAEEKAIAAEVSVSRRHFSYALDQLNRFLTVVDAFVGSRREWFTEFPTHKRHEQWRIRTLKLLPEPWKGLGLARRQRLDNESQPPQPWPKYYRRWQSHVAAYQEYLHASERGGHPCWESIELQIHGRVQSKAPPFA